MSTLSALVFSQDNVRNWRQSWQEKDARLYACQDCKQYLGYISPTQIQKKTAIECRKCHTLNYLYYEQYYAEQTPSPSQK